MLQRLYVHHFRCLVNFEIRFDGVNLILGPNGGGKSAVGDVLLRLRELLVNNTRVGVVFPADDLTAWVKNGETIPQCVELDIADEYGLFSYRLDIVHEPAKRKQRIESERLTLDGKPLFTFTRGEVSLFRDDHGAGPTYAYDWHLSALATIMPREDNKKLSRFKEWIERIFILRLDPRAMGAETETEAPWLEHNGGNFASWYRFISQEYQDKAFELTQALREILPGFHACKLEQAGKVRSLKIGFCHVDDTKNPLFFDFDRLSDGQRILIVLYALLFGLKDANHILFLDEPENFLALAEIQPWLMELNDLCADGVLPQAILVSHHPQLIDYFGRECGRWIEREPLGPARVKSMPTRIDDDLALSEQIARGWTE